MASKNTRGDISWSLPHPNGGFYKRPFAYSTVATSDLLSYLSEEGLTFHQGLAEIHFDEDASNIVKNFIHKGYGDHKMSEFIR